MTGLKRSSLTLGFVAIWLIVCIMFGCAVPTAPAAIGFHCAQVSDERGYLETDAAGNTIVDLHFCDPPFSTAGVFTALMAARVERAR